MDERQNKGTVFSLRREFSGVKLPFQGGFEGWPEPIGITFRAAWRLAEKSGEPVETMN